MSAASKHDAEQAAAEALAKENAYADAMIRREKLRGYSDDANRAQEDRERMERNRWKQGA